MFWQYRYTPSPDARVCCGANNRGVAILGDTLYLGTLDAHLVALDARTGKPIWNVEVGDVKLAYSITMMPLIVKDKVVVGVGGGEFGIRGYVVAYDAKTGKEAWKFYTIPAPGEPHQDLAVEIHAPADVFLLDQTQRRRQRIHAKAAHRIADREGQGVDPHPHVRGVAADEPRLRHIEQRP